MQPARVPVRHRQSTVPHPCCDPVQRTVAGVALEQKADPETDPVSRVGKQPGNRWCRHLFWCRRAVASLPPARTANFPDMCLDLDFDDLAIMTAVLHVGLGAARTDATASGGLCVSVLTRSVDAPSDRVGFARLLAALAAATRLGLSCLLAAATEPRLGMGCAVARSFSIAALSSSSSSACCAITSFNRNISLRRPVVDSAPGSISDDLRIAFNRTTSRSSLRTFRAL